MEAVSKVFPVKFFNEISALAAFVRNTLLLIFVLLVGYPSYSQTIGNEWIDFSQQYYKIPVANDGIYRLNYDGLSSAGFPVNNIDPQRIQLFHRGKEQAVFIAGENDGSFDPADYIEFYGKQNDGSLDSELYVSPDAQPHNFYNLYSDTTAYFLTVANKFGKRMNFSNVPVPAGKSPEVYYLDEKLILQTSNYWKGRVYSVDTYLSQFDYGEGWTGPRISKGNFIDYSFEDITDTYTSGAAPELEVLLTGRNNRDHDVDILVGGSAGSLRTFKNITFSGHDNKIVAGDLNWSDVSSNGQLIVRIKVNDLGNSDFVSLSYAKLKYPRKFNMDGEDLKVLSVPANASGKSWINLQNPPDEPFVYDITETDNISKIEFSRSGSEIAFIVPNAFTDRKILVTNNGFITPSINKVKFRKINPSRHNYLIISNRLLMKPVGEVADPVRAYAAYRATTEGGGFDTLVVDVHQLYDQFSFGETTPLAIRNFSRFMLNNGQPEYLFLVGRGQTVARKPYRSGGLVAAMDLVPSGGEPGADIAFTAGLISGDPFGPGIPTGRLTAQTPAEVLTYLNKVKETEKTPFDALWRKKMIHLSGGVSSSEIKLFRRYVEEFGEVAEGHYIGGEVRTVTKKTNNTVELINIADEVNKGVSFITFFGHSALEFTDIEVGLVSDDIQGYRNKGKYPFFLVNGCNAGNIFINIPSFGEDWILTPDRGALGFIAHTATGLSPDLKRYSDIFYATAFGDSVYISKPIGVVQKEVIKRYISRYSTSVRSIAQVQQMLLQGDPALKLFGADKPDYETNDDNLFLEPFDDKNITALTDSFKIGVIVKNFGITDHDSISAVVNRTLGNGQVISYDEVFYPPVLHQDTLFFSINNSGNESFGENRFEVILDPDDSVTEINESNNSGVINYFINLDGTTNLLPSDFGIVNTEKAKLISQSNDIFPESREFIFELDTIKTYNSPFKKRQVLTAAKLAIWEVGLLTSTAPNDSIVYYWRTKFGQPKAGEDSSWTSSSFIHIKDSPAGWAQVQFPQFDENQAPGLVRDSPLKKWEFEETETTVTVKTFGDNHPTKNDKDIELLVNGAPYLSQEKFKFCFDNAINAVAFDKSSTTPYLIFPRANVFDKFACGRTPQVINSFTHQNIRDNLILDQYIDEVRTGDFVLLFSMGNVSYQDWPESTRQKMLSIGASATTIASLNNGEPFIILGKKGGGPGTAIEITGSLASGTPVNEQEINLDQAIAGKFSKGAIISPTIGPAADWGTIHTKFILSNPGENDKVTYDVIGLDNQLNETILFNDRSDQWLDVSMINHVQYPYMKLKATIEDETDLSAAQLKEWLVIYKPVPEGVLLLSDNDAGSFKDIQKQEGEQFETNFIFRNISPLDFEDSLTVSYSIFNKSKRSTEVHQFKTSPLKANDTVKFTVPLTTLNKEGMNDLKVNINPRLLPEQNYNNNIIDLKDYYNVIRDNTNPLVDVAFDGEYIMSGDIVSPNPLISVIMRDENPFLQKKDTTGIDIFIKKPCEGCSFEKINFSNPGVNWTPADENSDYKVTFKPGTLEDGMHTLRVQASDASGNKSGMKPYEINFEVINESSITHFYPYPNPFSTSTRFVFTLTGSEIPDEIKVQVLTVTGKIVREITQTELGPLHIGNNISDYAWDGRDEFGDQLANGVYLYRVIVKNKGQYLENRKTSADQAFKKGYGKLYLLR